MSAASGAPRPHRPARYADLTEIIDAAGGEWTTSRAEVAAHTAQLVVAAGRDGGEASGDLVDLADQIGIDTLAALWRDADAVSLPGALWALYLLRQWCRTAPAEVARLWRAGEPLAPAEAAVAGVAEYPDPDAVLGLADAVLGGVYHGDLDVALERAAAFFRVVAAGRRTLPESDASGSRELAERNDRAARALSASAGLWRAGRLR